MEYRRAWQPGGTYFFTINLLRRSGNDLLVRHADVLRAIVARVRASHPFRIHAWVVLPDHMHCVIELPPGDTNFALRIRLIKMQFSLAIPATERRSDARLRRGERGIWQRRYWEHLIRDEDDYRAHIDYVHINPLKHGLVRCVSDWPHSTFHRLVASGVYTPDWAGGSGDLLSYED
jgi:putative transposase